MDVDDLINSKEPVPTWGNMSTEKIAANIRDSQIDELEENQEPTVIEPNVSTEVALDALHKLKSTLNKVSIWISLISWI